MADDELLCPRCGHANPVDANFCAVCGAPMNDDERDRTAAVPAVGPESGELPMVVVTRGENAGSRFSLADAVTTIGRHPDSAVFLDDVTVSRRHAEVRRSGRDLELVDVGSLNGTYLNGELVERSPLGEGDQLQIGKYRLVVVYGVVAGDG